MVYYIDEMKRKMKNLHVFHRSDYLYRNGGHNSDHRSNREEARSTRWEEEQKGRGRGRIPRANSDLSHTCSSVELKLSVVGERCGSKQTDSRWFISVPWQQQQQRKENNATANFAGLYRS